MNSSENFTSQHTKIKSLKIQQFFCQKTYLHVKKGIRELITLRGEYTKRVNLLSEMFSWTKLKDGFA